MCEIIIVSLNDIIQMRRFCSSGACIFFRPSVGLCKNYSMDFNKIGYSTRKIPDTGIALVFKMLCEWGEKVEGRCTICCG